MRWYLHERRRSHLEVVRHVYIPCRAGHMSAVLLLSPGVCLHLSEHQMNRRTLKVQILQLKVAAYPSFAAWPMACYIFNIPK